MAVAGASRYLAQATLANKQGSVLQTPNVLGEATFGLDLLAIGRQNAVKGIGISNSARALNKQFLSSTSSTFNQIFSLGIGATASVEGLQQEVLALRSRLPSSAISESARSIGGSSDGVSNSSTGNIVDEEA